MSTIRVVNLQHTDATEPNIVLLEDGTSVFASGITISGGTNLTVSGTAEFASGTVSAPGVTFIDDNNTGLYSPAADTVAITTAATERVRVDNAGNVGIGGTPGGEQLLVRQSAVANAPTRSSALYLESNGNCEIQFVGNSSNDCQLRFGTSSNSFKGALEYQLDNNALLAYVNGSEAMRIDSSGRVGINTSSPAATLSVDALAGNSTVCFLKSPTVNAYLQLGNSANDQGYVGYQSSDMTFYTAGSERIRIDSSGRLLVGTTTEGQVNADNLTINDSGDAGITIRSGSANAGSLFFSDNTTGSSEYAGYLQYDHSSDYFAIGTNTAERLRISSAGNVGIGTTVPDANVDIRGTNPSVLFSNSNKSKAYRIQLNESADALVINDNDLTERLRIDSSGRVGIGETSMDALLVIKGASDSATTPSIRLKDGSDTREAWITNASGDLILANGGNDNVPHAKLTLHDANLMLFYTANTERMRIDSSGRVGIATTTTNWFSGDHKLVVRNNVNLGSSSCVLALQDAGGQYPYIAWNAAGSGTRGLILFRTSGAGSVVGSITTDGSTTTYSPTSDYRVKENVVPLSNAIDRLNQLKPCRYNFKENTTNITRDGFLAHEVTPIVPDAVVGEKDAVDENGEMALQGLDVTKLIPLLTAALQEASAKIETLETEVAALKNN